METILLAAGIALLSGGLVGWLVGSNISASRLAQQEAEVARLAPLANQVPVLREQLAGDAARLEAAQSQLSELETVRARSAQAETEAAALKARLESAQQNFAEQTAALIQLRQEMQDQFQLLAGKALQANAEEFLRNATQVFENQKNLTNADIERRSKEMEEIVKPLGLSLQNYDLALKELEKSRISGFSEIDMTLKLLTTQNSEVRTVTANLVNALRASPKTRGRWAEHTLQRVMELSGLVEHCDFETEKHFRGDEESFRPDVVIQVAGDRTIIVDAKAPTSAYIDAVEAVTEEEREILLKLHAKQLRERLNDLSSKSYWEKIPGSTDCVIMFVPGDNFVSAAFERDHDLFEDGIKSRVLICTPTTFIALAKALAYGWRQEKLAANAVEVAVIGKELYSRLATMAGHVSLVGKHLKDGVNSYNKLVGSLESRVLPQARRFHELGVEGTSSEIEELSRVDSLTRPLNLQESQTGLLSLEEGET